MHHGDSVDTDGAAVAVRPRDRGAADEHAGNTHTGDRDKQPHQGGVQAVQGPQLPGANLALNQDWLETDEVLQVEKDLMYPAYVQILDRMHNIETEIMDKFQKTSTQAFEAVVSKTRVCLS